MRRVVMRPPRTAKEMARTSRATTEIAAAEIQHHVLLHDTHNLWPEFMEKAVGLKMTAELKRMHREINGGK